MNQSQLPPTAFVDPNGRNKSAVGAFSRQFLETVLAQLCQASNRAPLPQSPADTATATIPEEPVSEEQLLSSIATIAASSMNPAAPGFLGHMDPPPTTISMLAEYLAAALNNNMLSLEMSPFFSRLETSLLREFARRFGLGAQSGGVLTSGGSLANLQALAVARNHMLGRVQQGLSGLALQPVLFASEVAHTSIQKAAMLLGLGTQAVIPVRVNRNSQMDPEQLQLAIEQARTEAKLPFCVVASAGTTTTGNIDPLLELGRVARAHQLWFHVDAAYGGALIFSTRHRSRLAGIEQADSLIFNPQKWLYVAKTCAMALFRDWNTFVDAFRIQAPYMNEPEGFVNLGEISVQGTRHVDVLKLWFSLHHLGRRGYEQLIEQSYELASYFAEQVRQRPYLELAGTTETNIICFRGIPEWIAPEAWDRWNAGLQQYLLQHGQAFLSLPVYRGQRWLRAVLLNPHLERAAIDDLMQWIDRYAGAQV